MFVRGQPRRETVREIATFISRIIIFPALLAQRSVRDIDNDDYEMRARILMLVWEHLRRSRTFEKLQSHVCDALLGAYDDLKKATFKDPSRGVSSFTKPLYFMNKTKYAIFISITQRTS